MHAVSRLWKLRTDLRIVSSDKSSQRACTAVFGTATFDSFGLNLHCIVILWHAMKCYNLFIWYCNKIVPVANLNSFHIRINSLRFCLMFSVTTKQPATSEHTGLPHRAIAIIVVVVVVVVVVGLAIIILVVVCLKKRKEKLQGEPY